MFDLVGEGNPRPSAQRVADLTSRLTTDEKAHLIAIRGDSVDGGVPRLGIPPYDWGVEILHGAEDHVVPAQVHAVPLARDLPNANLTILPGIGHMPQHADPQSVVDAIDRAAIRAGLLASLPDTPQAARN